MHCCLQDTLFGRAKTPAERLREHQRSLQRAQRELDRERTKLEQQEKKLGRPVKLSRRAYEAGSYSDAMSFHLHVWCGLIRTRAVMDIKKAAKAGQMVNWQIYCDSLQIIILTDMHPMLLRPCVTILH